LANELVWLTWALLTREPGTIISAVVTGTCNTFVLTWLILRHRGVGPVFPRREQAAASGAVAASLDV
jgi:hypothetical protein